MLVGQDHVGGESTCWREEIMLVVEDTGKLNNFAELQFLYNGNTFLTQNGKNKFLIVHHFLKKGG